MQAKSFFVTGTDTDAGKTFVSCLLLTGFKAAGRIAVGAKPIAAGASVNATGTLENGDALLLQQHSGIALPYAAINPVCLAKAAAPHLAAAELGINLTEQQLSSQRQMLEQCGADFVLIEGAGGWLLPLDQERYLADWVSDAQLPVILVVGVKLGCLNHAMLTLREITRSGCKVLGWVANVMQPDMLFLDENIADLTKRLSCPLLATVPYQPEAKVQARLAATLAQAVLKQLA